MFVSKSSRNIIVEFILRIRPFECRFGVNGRQVKPISGEPALVHDVEMCVCEIFVVAAVCRNEFSICILTSVSPRSMRKPMEHMTVGCMAKNLSHLPVAYLSICLVSGKSVSW